MTTLSPSALDPFFVTVEAASLTSWRIGTLLAGRSAALRIPMMLNPAVCEETVGRLDTISLNLYDERRVNPPIARFGPAINDFRQDGRLRVGYWEEAASAARAWVGLGLECDPVRICIDAFRHVWPRPVRIATQHGRDLFAGMVREINGGAHVHYDDVVREFPHGVFDTEVVAQLAFNLYLSMPKTGGETIIWRRRWHPADEEHRNGYGYSRALVSQCQSIAVKPRIGDGLLFDPRNYHAVAPGEGERRIAVAFFVALSAQGELLIWS